MSDFVQPDKLRIKDGVIHYRIYGQDGIAVPMTCRDTVYNRWFVAWVQVHDRHEESWKNPGQDKK